ncbi:hypothetical protein [Deinococcus aquatilis]|uniref:hypothetical protein n=1 Tax=Deinococcus aquatilis TaxID=519440 RepID=UPI000377C87A|nr:hypothetical protein [Deinococcus aquatilis]
MSKKAQKRAARRAQITSHLSQSDDRRDWLMQQEARGRVQTTPKQWKQRDPTPWYLPDLGLEREPFIGQVPRYQPGVVIRRFLQQ